MRNIILILILAIASVNLSAQEKITIKKGEKIKEIKKGAYYEKSTESLEKFTGEWISKETNFKIILSIEKIFFKGPDIYMDALVGKYSYNSSEIDDKEFSFKTTSTTGENGKTASFLFQDKEKNKNGDLHLKILDRDKMKWTLKNTEGIRFGEFDKTFSVPIDVLLTKVE